MSTMAEIMERLAQVPMRKRRPTAAAFFSQEEEFLQAQRESLKFLKGNSEAGRVPPPPPPLKQPPVAGGGDLDDDPGDNDNVTPDILVYTILRSKLNHVSRKADQETRG